MGNAKWEIATVTDIDKCISEKGFGLVETRNESIVVDTKRPVCWSANMDDRTPTNVTKGSTLVKYWIDMMAGRI